MRHSLFGSTAVLALGLAVACGDGGGGPIGPGGDDGSGTLGVAGGTVRLQTLAGVTVPAGALSGNVTITVTAVAMPAALQAAGAIGQAYRFTPEGQQFQLPVEVFVFVPNSALAGVDPTDLTLLATTSTGLDELTGITVDIAASGITVRGFVTHFTVIAAAVEDDGPPPNQAPDANAGVDQNANAGTAVTLQGGGSTDPDGDPLAFEWRTLSSPSGVTVSLTGAGTALATFTPTVAGVYEFELTVSDGELAARDTVRVTVAAANQAPSVDAGTDQSITLGGTANVTATATDPDADALTYAWVVQSRPAGSTAVLSATTTPAVAITPDVAGAYVLRVTVNDGRGGQAVDEVTITATAPGMNRAPVANAGFDLNGTETIPMTLDGSASFDPDGDELTFSWSILSAPTGSTVSIVGATGATASLTPGLEGVYVVQLEVSDGEFTSTDTATLTVGPFNHPPVGTLTIAGGAQVMAGASVTATAAFTDADGDPLELTWTLDAPDGSAASLVLSGDETQATFTADVPGDYGVSVSVTDGGKTAEAEVTVTAFPVVGGTYSTDFTLTFISSVCQGVLGLGPGESQIRDMIVTQSAPQSATLGISALIPNVQDDPVASLSPSGLAIFDGPIVLETGTDPPTITASGNITQQFAFGNGPGSPATGFEGSFSFSALGGLCVVQGTLVSPPD
ncbi:MAG TPA: tandem-95 repeat protein [Gemmatimonadota bacterium]|nr:tandem-95 repeat protein [Gemmatimonadota bacterium]